MNIIGTQYTLKTKAFEIYVAGCNGSPHCKGCHNPESWSFQQGDLCTIQLMMQMVETIKQFDTVIENIMIFGGEPLDQDLNDLSTLISYLKTETRKQIWIFTRYTIEEVSNLIKDVCDYIKCGRYEETLRTNDNLQYGIHLATSNQHIYKKGLDY